MLLLSPYWTMWERSVGFDLRAERAAMARQAAEALAHDVDVVAVVQVDSEAAGVAAARAADGVEAILVLQTMAVPPGYTLAALQALPDVPVVIWACHRHERIPAGFDHGAITSEGATVGTPMLTSTLKRSGRFFTLIVGRLGDAGATAGVTRNLRVAAAARRLRRARIGRIGQPVSGYVCVDLDNKRLRARTGIEMVPIPSVRYRELFLAVTDERVRDVVEEICGDYDVDPGVGAEMLRRTARAAAAVEDVMRLHELDAAAFNCLVPEIRFSSDVGVTACFGLGRMTSRGAPMTCMGDALTPVVMLATQLLGAASQYHELETLDYATGEMVIASSGEHDLAFADPSVRPRLVPNLWFAEDEGNTACAAFNAPAGPATLAAFAQIDAPEPAYRMIVARGEFTESSWPGVGTASAAFRFTSGPVTDAWRRWCEAGASHHSAATPGDVAADLRDLGSHLGIEVVEV